MQLSSQSVVFQSKEKLQEANVAIYTVWNIKAVKEQQATYIVATPCTYYSSKHKFQSSRHVHFLEHAKVLFAESTTQQGGKSFLGNT